jgi:hypothetical protein
MTGFPNSERASWPLNAYWNHIAQKATSVLMARRLKTFGSGYRVIN